MFGEDCLCILPLVHPRLLLDHQVPDVLPVRPAQLGQGGGAPLTLARGLGYKGSETETKMMKLVLCLNMMQQTCLVF